MSSHLDIIGSVIIAGMVILNFAFFMGERTESQVESTNRISAQTDVSDVTQTLRFDLRKVGFGCDSLPILRATENSFVFRADLENDGKVDTVGYYFGTASTLLNEKTDGLLYRIVNRVKQRGQDLNLTDFRFVYFTKNTYGTLSQTTDMAKIHAIGVRLRVRSGLKEADGYRYSLNEFTVTPKNL